MSRVDPNSISSANKSQNQSEVVVARKLIFSSEKVHLTAGHLLKDYSDLFHGGNFTPAKHTYALGEKVPKVDGLRPKL